MSGVGVIVLYGRDGPLLESRRLVLQSSGHQVEAYLELADLKQRLASAPVDLLILCHSLSSVEYEAAVAAANLYQPRARLLALLTADISPNLNRPIAHVSARDGPTMLLAVVAKLLSRPATQSEAARPQN